MISKWLRNEFITGQTPFSMVFLFAGIVIQVISYLLTNDTFISMICGISGVLAVVLCSQRKISQYFFGFIQNTTYIYLAFDENLYGKIFENGFYIVTMLIGVFLWLRHYGKSEDEGNEVESRKLSPKGLIFVFSLLAIGYTATYLFLSHTNDSQPFMDSLATVPAFIAQILLVLRYREQWLFWLIIDIGSIMLWWNAGNMCMTLQFVFWTANCFYGYIKWEKAKKIERVEFRYHE